MVTFLIDNIYVAFGGNVYQQTVGIPIGTNCAPLVADLFLYSYEAGILFIETSLKQGCSSRKLQATFRQFYGRHTHLVHKFDTSLSHMLEGLFTNCDTWLVSIFWVNRDGCRMWAGYVHSFLNTWLPPIWRVHDFTHSLYIHYWICQLLDYDVYGLMTPVCLPGLLLCFGLILHCTVIPLFMKPSGLGYSVWSLEKGVRAWESPQNM